MKPRWKRALENSNNFVGEQIGKLFVEKHFPEEQKKRVLGYIHNIGEVFKERVAKLDWMSDSTKTKALDKLSKFTYKIGYPDKWKDFSSIEITKDNFVQNMMNVSAFEYAEMMGKLGKPVDKTEWGMTPQTINAYYNPTMNEIVFPAAILDLEIVNKQTQNREQQNFMIEAPAPGDTTFFDITSSTLGKVGKNDVNVFVNKRVLAETYYDNNFIVLPDYLNVLADKIPPTMEVTFDNRALRNGDYVSPTPEIIISMVDESLFRFKSDTLGVTLLLSYPCGSYPCPFKRIPLSGSDVKWYAATVDSNFRIEFTPQLGDGDYVFSAQVAYASGNLSGAPSAQQRGWGGRFRS